MIKKCRTVIHPKWKGTASAICWMGLSRKFSHYLVYSAKTFTKIPGHFASFVSKTRDGAGDVIKKCISNMWKKNVEQYQDLRYVFFVHKKSIDNSFSHIWYTFFDHITSAISCLGNTTCKMSWKNRESFGTIYMRNDPWTFLQWILTKLKCFDKL